jgi:hypothetical protein
LLWVLCCWEVCVCSCCFCSSSSASSSAAASKAATVDSSRCPRFQLKQGRRHKKKKKKKEDHKHCHSRSCCKSCSITTFTLWFSLNLGVYKVCKLFSPHLLFFFLCCCLSFQL